MNQLPRHQARANQTSVRQLRADLLLDGLRLLLKLLLLPGQPRPASIFAAIERFRPSVLPLRRPHSIARKRATDVKAAVDKLVPAMPDAVVQISSYGASAAFVRAARKALSLSVYSCTGWPSICSASVATAGAASTGGGSCAVSAPTRAMAASFPG